MENNKVSYDTIKKNTTLDQFTKEERPTPNYKYAIWNKSFNKMIINPESRRPFFFEFPAQACEKIKQMGNSPNLCVYDLSKRKCGETPCGDENVKPHL